MPWHALQVLRAQETSSEEGAKDHRRFGEGTMLATRACGFQCSVFAAVLQALKSAEKKAKQTLKEASKVAKILKARKVHWYVSIYPLFVVVHSFSFSSLPFLPLSLLSILPLLFPPPLLCLSFLPPLPTFLPSPSPSPLIPPPLPLILSHSPLSKV